MRLPKRLVRLARSLTSASNVDRLRVCSRCRGEGRPASRKRVGHQIEPGTPSGTSIARSGGEGCYETTGQRARYVPGVRAATPLTGARILIADDQEINRLILNGILSQDGYELMEVETARKRWKR